MSSCNRFCTIQEGIDFVESSGDNGAVITIIPPDSGDKDMVSDEENCPETIQTDEIFETAGEVEVFIDNHEETEYIPESGHEEPRWRKHINFTKNIFKENSPPKLSQSLPDLVESSPYDIWQLFFPEDVVVYLHHQTVLYARRDRNDSSFDMSIKEMRCFLGILVFSGYHFVTSERDYWSNQPDLSVSFISRLMTRDRYLRIKKYFHPCDNQSLKKNDKTAKVAYLYETLNQKLIQFGIFHKKLCVDESMVPYYGKHGAKMFIRGKPIRFGYKIWTLCGSDGFPYQLNIYAGKSTEEPRSSSPLGQTVVTKLLEVVEKKSEPRNHEIYFDNFFTSIQLLEILNQKDFPAIGTIRSNRMQEASKFLKTDLIMKREGRGAYDFCCNGKTFICKWNDNSIVHIASNQFTHEPVKKATRYIKKGGRMDVSQPHLITLYNQGMGGVDVMDKLLGSYRPLIRGKKWWWPLVINVLNVSIVAAWRFHCSLNESKANTTHLQFRRDIALCLLNLEEPRTQPQGGARSRLPINVRLDGAGHHPVPCAQGRCVVCSKNTTASCKKCEVRLHYSRGSQCFHVYHERK